MIDIATASDAEKTVLVLGANAKKIRNHIDLHDIFVVQNHMWKDGLSYSIRTGLETMLQINPQVEAVILMLCDQPFLSAEVLNEIITKHIETGKEIVNCCYDLSFGPPTLFYKSMFPRLMQLTSSHGAKSIVQECPQNVTHVDFPKGNIDIDTTADYQSFLQNDA